jgi:hypothetical protein
MREAAPMSHDGLMRAGNGKMWLGGIAIAEGLATPGLALIRLEASDAQRMAQGTPPLQSSPPAENTDKPAESKPGGTRPTTPAPEPARPDPEAQKAGAKPALPPAPAEKVAPPIKEK